MSLNPHWFSHIYGVLFMVGQALSALALMIVLRGPHLPTRRRCGTRCGPGPSTTSAS